ncbi:MAG: carboxypeptidase-like regulatory domain-containing protein [Desulfuromonadaceae bacterium]|nr:carboxypeptidase-like regulatory domain-containing protein [Desulfuromonadaceae bacterium]
MKLITIKLILFLMLPTLVFAESITPTAEQETPTVTSGTLSGRAMINPKKPMSNGVVLLFNKDMGPPPHPYNYWRIPDMISGTDTKGNFIIDVPEGTYYLMIAQKKPNGEIGPPNEKEYLYFHGDNMLKAKPVTVDAGSEINLGTLLKSNVWSPKKVAHSKGITAIEGTVTNMEDKAIERAVVFAYLNPNAFGRPSYVSDRTDKKGRFQLRLYEGGTYYLKVRGVIGGGTPDVGEYQNATKEYPPVEVTVQQKKILRGVILKVDKFTGKGLKSIGKIERTWENTGNLQNQ